MGIFGPIFIKKAGVFFLRLFAAGLIEGGLIFSRLEVGPTRFLTRFTWSTY